MSALVPLGVPHCLWLAFQAPLAGIPGSVINLFDQTYWSRGHRQSKKCWLIQSSSRLRLHGIVPNAGRSGQVVPGSLLTLFPVISDFRNGGHLLALEVGTGSLEITVHSTGLSR